MWFLALVVPGIILALGGSSRLLGLGAVSWLAAVLIKIPAAIVVAIVLRSSPLKLRATIQGMLSAIVELGGAALLLSRVPDVAGVLDILAFACGAGSLEALLLLVVAAIKQAPPDEMKRWTDRAAQSAIVRHAFAIERTLAWFGHLGSRSLTAIAVLHGNLIPVVIAFATFSVTDGTAGYLSERGVDWFDPLTLERYFRLTAWLVVVELVALSLVPGILGI